MDFYITTNMKVWTFAFRNLSAIYGMALSV